MTQTTKQVAFQLPNGRSVSFEANVSSDETATGGVETDVVGFKDAAFSEVTSILEGIATALIPVIDAASPSKLTVEFGMDIGLETGQITALIVKGTGKANLKITLEWEKNKT